MKIMGVSAEQCGSGMKVTLSYFVAGNEELEDADAQRILDLARELAGDAGDTGSGAPVRGGGAASDVSEDAPRRRKAVAEEDGEEKDPTPRRRSRSEPEEDASGAEKPTRRGRSTAEEPEESAPRRRSRTADTATETAGSTRSRTSGRVSAEPDEDAEERPTTRRRTAASPDAEEKPSRSRGQETSEPKRRGAEPTKISDEDLMKACSATSRVTSSKVVLKIVEQFGVGEVSKIAQGERQEFLDLCKEARDKA